jgi:hypothetical protein
MRRQSKISTRRVEKMNYWNPHMETLFRDKGIGGSADVRKEGKTGSYSYPLIALIS